VFLILLACNGPASNDRPGPADDTAVLATTIGPEGGAAVSADGHFTVEVPAGALSEDVEITLEPLESETGFGYEMGPDGLEFDLPARATFTMALDETGFQDGEWLTLPVIVSVSGDTVEGLDAQVTLDEDYVASSEIEHFSSWHSDSQYGNWRVRSVVRPSNADEASFDLPVGATATSTVEVQVVTPPGIDEPVDAHFIDIQKADTVGVVELLDRGLGKWALRNSGETVVDPRRIKCAEAGTGGILRDVYLEMDTGGGEPYHLDAVLRTFGKCRAADDRENTPFFGDVIGRTKDGTRVLVDNGGEISTVDPDSGEKTVLSEDVGRFQDLGDGLYIGTTDQYDGRIEQVQIYDGSAWAEVPGASFAYDDGDVFFQVLNDGRVLVVVRNGDDYEYGRTQVYLVTIGEGGIFAEFVGHFGILDGYAAAARVGNRIGLPMNTGVLVATAEGLVWQTETETETVNPEPAEDVKCGPKGSCVVDGEGTVSGYLWTDPAQPPTGAGGFDLDLDLFEEKVQLGDQFGSPGVSADDEFVFVWVQDGTLQGWGLDLEGSCENPSGATVLKDGRGVLSCPDEDQMVVLPPVVEEDDEDLDALIECETDLFEGADLYPGHPVKKSSVSALIGAQDTEDRFYGVVDVPESCENPRVVVSVRVIDAPQDAALTVSEGIGGANYEELDKEVHRTHGEDSFWVTLEAEPGTSRVVDLEVKPVFYTASGCIDYALSATLQCTPDADLNEDDDTIEDVDPVELGDGESIVFNDLTISPGDNDVFGVSVPGACDLEVEAVYEDEEESQEINPLSLLGQVEYAITDLGSSTSSTPGPQALSVSTGGAGDVFFTVESLFAGIDDYSVSVAADCPFDCYSDTFEPNNTFAKRDVYYDKYMGDTWGSGDVFTVSATDTDWWETPVAVFGCYEPGELHLNLTIHDGDPGAELHMNVTNKYGETLLSDEVWTASGEVIIEGAVGKYPYSTDLYVEMWGEGGCVEAELAYELVCP